MRGNRKEIIIMADFDIHTFYRSYVAAPASGPDPLASLPHDQTTNHGVSNEP